MKKRILSCLMALALCLTLLPTAALAEETDASETTDESVAAVQVRIDALPDAAELDGMDNDDAMAAYDAVQAAYDAYEALTEAQQAEITGADRFEALFGWFNEQVAPLANPEINPDGVDANGNIITDTSYIRTGPLLTASDKNLSGKYYIVQGNITINGDLTVDGSQMGGLVLCDGATLTVKGALIHTGGSAFYIYGQTLATGSNGTGKLVIKNSLDNGAAIRSDNTYPPSLSINSGVVEICAGSSEQLVDGVSLFSSKPIHKGILDGNVVPLSDWSQKPSISGTSLDLEYCEHPNPAYTPSGSAKHKKSCAQCGFNTSGLSQNLVDCTFDGKGGYAQDDENGHYALCICGNRATAATAHGMKTTWTDDGQWHISKCTACGYTSGEPQEHTYKDGTCTVCGYACPHKVVENGKCTVCQMTGIVATVDGTAYTEIAAAVTDWLANGGTLTLYADGTVDFTNVTAAGKQLTIDLNGHRINCDSDGNGDEVKLNGVDLTIRDSKAALDGAFGPIIADRGTLTMEDGYLNGLTVPDDSTAKFHLHGGKVNRVSCSKPVYTLLDDGYALMNGNITVGPTTILEVGSQVYTVRNAQLKDVQKGETVSAVIGSNTIPFALSLKTDDKEIGRMRFEWYRIDSESKTATLLAASKDVYPENGVYTCNAADVTVDPNGWTGLEANKTYKVLCVVIGKEGKGAYCWQTPMRGYTLTVTPASLNSGNTVIEVTNANSLVYTGQPLTPEVKVTYNSAELTKDKDYTVSYADNTNAGTATVTVTGKDNYGGTVSKEWKIIPAELDISRVTVPDKAYDGTADATGTDVTFTGLKNNENFTAEDYAVTAQFNNASVEQNKSVTGTVKLKENSKTKNYVLKDGGAFTASGNITKADAPTSTEQQTVTVTNNRAHTYEFDLSALLPKLESPKEYGEVTYALGTDAINFTNDGYYDATKESAEVKDGKLILPIQAVETKETGSIGSVEVKVSTTNYHDFTLTINVEATNKTVPTGTPTLSKTTLAWGEQLNTITLSGAMKDGDTEVKGTFVWTSPETTPDSMSDFEAEWKFTPTETAVYAETSGMVTIKVIKATPTGAPKYTAITTGGKTLEDASLTAGTIQPEGTIQWELDETTVVTANTAYKWVFTPKDQENYDVLTGFITPYSVSSNTGGSSSGGSSSGGSSSSDRDSSDSNPIIKTETKNNPDGSTTKTETRKDGSVTQTTTSKDGGVSKTETKKDGSSVTENKAADGSTGTVKTDKNGQTEAKTALSSKAVEDAKKSGEPVKAPVEVEASRNSNTAPTVKVELPQNSGKTEVEIPVSNAKPGTVAVLVHPDGTEEILKASVPTENGIRLTVDGSATVKIVDNSKDFIDTRNHWAREEIDFVSARELVNGMTATIYAPNASATRAQLWTILARQNDANLSGGNTWYEKAQLWSKDKGISDGTEPNAAINRAQMVTMLWRTMGQPTATDKVSFADVPAGSYYAQAVAWAVESGITAGVGGGRFDPSATCTRAQIAAFLARSMK